MWTATITGKDRIEGSLRIRVLFTNGTNQVEELYLSPNPDLTWLKRQVKARIDQLVSMDIFDTNLTLGSFDSTPTPESIPTQAETDRRQFLTDYTRYISIKHAIDVGVLTGNEVPVQALLQKIKDNFKPVYLNEL